MSAPLESPPEPLFYEHGASWYWLLAGPAVALGLLAVQVSGGGGYGPVVPVLFLVMVSGMLGIQVKAARIHASVELTATQLRQGTELLGIDEIVAIYPEKPRDAEPQPWESDRVLGELTSVPRGRGAIGLRLTRRRTVQAWARRHRRLRAALMPLVEQRAAAGPEPLDGDEGLPW